MSHPEIGQINRALEVCETVGSTACSQIIPRIGDQKRGVFIGVFNAPLPIRKQ